MDEIKVTLFDRWTWIRDWVKENKTQAIILGLILLIGAFFRLYRVSEYMTFLGDEGRDVIVVRRLLVDFDPILVGPGTSIGNMYLGPLYYYMMAPALLLASFSPAGPAIMIALLGIITVGFIWWVGKEWFSTNAGLIAAGLYAISPVVITYSRSSWNPNIMPFFALLAVYAIDQVWRHHRFNWLLVASISFAFILQSHYLGFLIAPVLGIFWFITLLTLILRKKIIKQKEKKVALRRDTKSFVRLTFVSIGIVTILMSPLVVFDARHGWRNFISMKKFFLERQTTVSARPWTALPKLPEITSEISTRLLANGNQEIGNFAVILIVFLLIVVLIDWQMQENHRLQSITLLSVWLAIALIGLGVFKQEIYDHYYGFFFPAPFLLLGGLLTSFSVKEGRLGDLLAILATGLLVTVNFQEHALKYPPNRQLQRAMGVVRRVDELSGGRPFNFAVLAERNYEGAYMYFFEMWSIPATVAIADQLDETLKDQLFVVCELPREKCTPEGSDRPEITNFGWLEKIADWEFEGVIIIKYIHPK